MKLSLIKLFNEMELPSGDQLDDEQDSSWMDTPYPQGPDPRADEDLKEDFGGDETIRPMKGVKKPIVTHQTKEPAPQTKEAQKNGEEPKDLKSYISLFNR